MKSNKKGFTIVELVIVIAIIAVLAAVLIPIFAGLIRTAQANSDMQLIRNLNTALRVDKPNEKHPTMQSALDAAAVAGYDVSRINKSAVDENEILWDSKNDVFCYLVDDESQPRYIPEFPEKENAELVDYFRIANDVDVDSRYSTYLYEYEGESQSITTSKGLDVGTESVAYIKYENSDAQNVVIRTNSAATTLTIDDSSTGSIYHYGSAGALNIIQCHTASYHEYGKVAFAEIAKGRIVLESGSEIKHIHVDKKDNTSFDTVIIADNGAKALPEKITRDEVTVEAATLVVKVESNGSSEEVYVYPNGTTGTTEKTDTQNTSVVSALGQLVLDNGSNAGEKAMSNNDKEETKKTVVDILASEEINEANESGANYVVRIGAKGYESFEKGFNAMVDGDTLTMVQNATLNKELVKGTAGNTATTGNYVIDLGGYTLTTTSDLTKLSYNDGGYDAVMDFYNINVTLKNGTIDDSNNVPGSTICVLDNANAILENLSITFTAHSANYGCLLTDTISGGTPTLLVKDCSLEIYGCGAQIAGNATATFENCDINQTMAYASGKYSRNCIATSGGSNVIINGGNYTSSAFCLYVYNSGGGFVVNSGTFTGEYVVRMDNNPKSEGFNSQSNYGGHSVFTANGGQFTGKLSQSIKNNGICEWIDNGGTFSSDNYSTYFTQNND